MTMRFITFAYVGGPFCPSPSSSIKGSHGVWENEIPLVMATVTSAMYLYRINRLRSALAIAVLAYLARGEGDSYCGDYPWPLRLDESLDAPCGRTCCRRRSSS